MVELVDTLVSGTSAFSGMEVQVFFRAKKPHTADYAGGGGSPVPKISASDAII